VKLTAASEAFLLWMEPSGIRHDGIVRRLAAIEAAAVAPWREALIRNLDWLKEHGTPEEYRGGCFVLFNSFDVPDEAHMAKWREMFAARPASDEALNSGDGSYKP
jgi:hypothetical protein